jgi:hypothetical protein
LKIVSNSGVENSFVLVGEDVNVVLVLMHCLFYVGVGCGFKVRVFVLVGRSSVSLRFLVPRNDKQPVFTTNNQCLLKQ